MNEEREKEKVYCTEVQIRVCIVLDSTKIMRFRFQPNMEGTRVLQLKDRAGDDMVVGLKLTNRVQ